MAVVAVHTPTYVAIKVFTCAEVDGGAALLFFAYVCQDH